MTTFPFDIDEINELVLQGHSYISQVGIKIIDDKNSLSSSIVEGHFYDFLDLLEVVEERKDLETTDEALQQLVLRLYGYVQNECVYYNSLYLDLDNPMYSGSVTVSIGLGNRLNKTQANLINGGTDDEPNWYLPYLDNNGQPITIAYLPVFVKSNNQNIAGFLYDDSFSPPRIYGFANNDSQIITVVLL